MSSIVRNTDFDNLVNYENNQSSASVPQLFNYNSVEPTCISNLSKNQQIVEYHILVEAAKTPLNSD